MNKKEIILSALDTEYSELCEYLKKRVLSQLANSVNVDDIKIVVEVSQEIFEKLNDISEVIESIKNGEIKL